MILHYIKTIHLNKIGKLANQKFIKVQSQNKLLATDKNTQIEAKQKMHFRDLSLKKQIQSGIIFVKDLFNLELIILIYFSKFIWGKQ